VEYSYDAGDLTGENEIAIRRFQLGDRLGGTFEDRVGISLRLAVALLQDADGSIRLAIPVSGNLDDPQFDWGGIIWRAVRNAVIKFVSAPLRLLGNIATLGGRITEVRLDPIEFEPGSTELKANGEKQLSELATVLKNKPKLDAELRGFASPKELDALKRNRLRRQISESGEDYESAVRRLYGLATKGRRDSENPPVLAEIEAYLAERVVLPDGALQELAGDRVSFVEERLTKAGIERDRLFTESQISERLPGRVQFELLA
jgi:hypothetical protein